jgi:hypothetical protein
MLLGGAGRHSPQAAIPEGVGGVLGVCALGRRAVNETSNREARSRFRTRAQQAGSGSSIRGLAPTGTSRNVIQSSRVVVPVLRAM